MPVTPNSQPTRGPLVAKTVPRNSRVCGESPRERWAVMLAPIVIRNEAVAILMFAASALLVAAIAFTF